MNVLGFIVDDSCRSATRIVSYILNKHVFFSILELSEHQTEWMSAISEPINTTSLPRGFGNIPQTPTAITLRLHPRLATSTTLCFGVYMSYIALRN